MTSELPSPFARCRAEIDLAALRHNVGVVREAVGLETTILAIIKADAYGHGMVPVARALWEGSGVRDFGVASVAEGLHLRGGLPEARVTILSPALPGERAEIVRQGFLPWLSSVEEAADYARIVGRRQVDGTGQKGLTTEDTKDTKTREEGEGRRQKAEGRRQTEVRNEARSDRAAGSGREEEGAFAVEIKLDTGMGRIGVLEADFEAMLAAVRGMPELRVAGILTHLPSPDEDAAFTAAQLERMTRWQERVGLPGRFHAQNSAGLLGYAREGRNLVRPGLMLYGASPLPAFQGRLWPVLTLKTRVSLVRTLPAGHGVSYGRTFVTERPTRVGTLAVGYADGYPRHLTNVGAEVLVRGRRCPLLGRVTMDQVMIDVSALPPDVGPGEEAVLIGRQGGELILAGELAAKSGTIPWEIFTGLTARVARRYLGA